MSKVLTPVPLYPVGTQCDWLSVSRLLVGTVVAQLVGMRFLGSILLLMMGCTVMDSNSSTVRPVDFVEDVDSRRAALEYAMWQPELPYSKKLLNHYALDDSGWELLPEVSLEVAPFYVEQAQSVGHEGNAWSGAVLSNAVPMDEEEWLALGQDVFWRLPMRRDAYLRWLLQRPELWEEVGLNVLPDGSVAGIAAYQDPDGNVDYGVTCALCHSSEGLAGRANRRLDIGLARARYAEYMGRDGSEFLSWGPGRIDVTEDGVDNPVAIPDLWGLEHAEYINHSGSIRMAGPETLAVRMETQYIQNHRMRRRPPRTHMWALSRFVLSRTPPQHDTSALNTEWVENGNHLFQEHCGDCHWHYCVLQDAEEWVESGR